jgi:hypothetical protein
MALTFHRNHHHDDSPVAIDLDAEASKAFRTAEGETIRFDGVTPDEAAAKADEFLAWAG